MLKYPLNHRLLVFRNGKGQLIALVIGWVFGWQIWFRADANRLEQFFNLFFALAAQLQ